MLQRFVFAAALLLVLPLAGCFVVSVSPLAEHKDFPAADPAQLAGVWHDTDKAATDCEKAKAKPGGEKACTFEFKPAAEIYYDIAMTDENLKVTELSGRLVQLGPALFLDVTAKERPDITVHLLQVHSFWKVVRDGNTLKLIGMRPDTIKRLLEQPRPLVTGTVEDSIVILTDSSWNLQEFVKKYADDPRVFDPASALTMSKQ
jgi:hypothetical protein